MKGAPPYKATVQELRSDSEPDEEISAYIASVKKVPVKRFDDRAMHVHNCNDTQGGSGAMPSLPLEPVCGPPHLPPCALPTMFLGVTSRFLDARQARLK